MFISCSLLTSSVNSCDKIEYLFRASKQVEFLTGNKTQHKASCRSHTTWDFGGQSCLSLLRGHWIAWSQYPCCSFFTFKIMFNICARISFPYSICPSVWNLCENAQFLLIIINFIIQESYVSQSSHLKFPTHFSVQRNCCILILFSLLAECKSYEKQVCIICHCQHFFLMTANSLINIIYGT